MGTLDLIQRARALEARARERENKQHTANRQDESRSLTDNTVTKSNALARAYYRFGLVEKRVMEAVVSKLNPLTADKPQPIRITAQEYADAFSCHEKTAYRDLEAAGKAIVRRIIQVRESDSILHEFPLASRATYNSADGAGSVTIVLSSEITPHLIDLRNRQFVKYGLKECCDFSSSYTWRLYEVLLSHQMDKKFTGGLIAGEWRYEIGELRKLLGVPISYQWVHISKMLDHSRAEILEHAKIQIEIERIKTGRRISHLKFQFAELPEKKQRNLPLQGGKGGESLT